MALVHCLRAFFDFRRRRWVRYDENRRMMSPINAERLRSILNFRLEPNNQVDGCYWFVIFIAPMPKARLLSLFFCAHSYTRSLDYWKLYQVPSLFLLIQFSRNMCISTFFLHRVRVDLFTSSVMWVDADRKKTKMYEKLYKMFELMNRSESRYSQLNALRA